MRGGLKALLWPANARHFRISTGAQSIQGLATFSQKLGQVYHATKLVRATSDKMRSEHTELGRLEGMVSRVRYVGKSDTYNGFKKYCFIPQ